MTKFFLSLFFVLTFSFSAALAQTFDDGFAAFEAGDATKAIKIWLELADKGDVKSQYNLGYMSENGIELEQNFEQAIIYYKLAAEQGYANAQLNIGSMYAKGLGVEQNLVTAVKWYEKAAEQGLPLAQANLGINYLNGHGVRRNSEKALFWLRKASTQGAFQAQSYLGLMYVQGKGVEKSNSRAYMWWLIANYLGFENVKANLDKVTNLLSKEELDKANAMAETCLNSNYKECGQDSL